MVKRKYIIDLIQKQFFLKSILNSFQDFFHFDSFIVFLRGLIILDNALDGFKIPYI